MVPPSIDENAMDAGNTKSLARSSSTTSSNHSDHSGSTKSRSKEDLWKGAVVKEITTREAETEGASATKANVQIIGLESKQETVYARVVLPSSPTDETDSNPVNPQVSIGKAIEVVIEEEYQRLIKLILEKHKHVENDSHPPAKELLRLGAVWLINESSYIKGENTNAQLLKESEESLIPQWENMTLRVHLSPDRFHMANEVDWSKYCKGLLLDNSIDVSIASEKPHTPISGLPDSKDGVIVYRNDELGYAVLNKPCGVPFHATKSNHYENVAHLFAEALAKEKQETTTPKGKTAQSPHVGIIPHMSEAEKEGLVLVSTKRDFDVYFSNHVYCNKKTTLNEKTCIYRCLICVPDDKTMDQLEKFQQSGSVITHFENPRSPAPKKFLRNKPKGDKNHHTPWLKCDMKILRIGDRNSPLRAAYVNCASNSEAVDQTDPEITLAHRLWGMSLESTAPKKSTTPKYVMDIEVELVSDQWRPHQLRGQLAALGCPIVGDTVYGGGTCETGAHGHTCKRMAAQCCQLSFPMPEWKEEEAKDEVESEEKNSSTEDSASTTSNTTDTSSKKATKKKKPSKAPKKQMVPSSDKKCEFRLHHAWWSQYMTDYHLQLQPPLC